MQSVYNSQCKFGRIQSRGRLFLFKQINERCEEENMKKFGFLELHISGTTGPISFKFDMQGNKTVGHL